MRRKRWKDCAGFDVSEHPSLGGEYFMWPACLSKDEENTGQTVETSQRKGEHGQITDQEKKTFQRLCWV
jgi:hypothetical protein